MYSHGWFTQGFITSNHSINHFNTYFSYSHLITWKNIIEYIYNPSTYKSLQILPHAHIIPYAHKANSHLKLGIYLAYFTQKMLNYAFYKKKLQQFWNLQTIISQSTHNSHFQGKRCIFIILVKNINHTLFCSYKKSNLLLKVPFQPPKKS